MADKFIVLCVVAFLIFALYKELFKPALTFFICITALLIAGVISPAEILKGLSSQQIIVIFLLVLVTAGIRGIYGVELFEKIFATNLKPKVFLLRMMLLVSSLSAFLNNTPIVAFMIPYVKDWSDRSGHPVSKFLIPLSFATILGGMITVIGTSTNLVLNGLIAGYNLPLLEFTDFIYLGLIVTVVGWIYLYFIGYSLLPDNPNKIEVLRENLKEYIVETEISGNSKLIGASIRDAGLRNLKDVFLVEIIRDEKVISPVSPDMVLEAGDYLFFSGNTQSIYDLIKSDNGLSIHRQDKMMVEGQFNFVEAVIPANSDLIGVRIRDSDFRNRYKASIIAIHRNGRRVAGKVGEMVIAGGDFMLLLAGAEPDARAHEKDIFYISSPKTIEGGRVSWHRWVGLACLLSLLLGAVGVIPLFITCVLILCSFLLIGVLSPLEIKRQLDLSLLMVLVCSLAIGVALEKSGAASLVAGLLLNLGTYFGPFMMLTGLFLVTTLLTALITNAAAVSIVFPIAMSMATLSDLPKTPFFVAIAFAASGDFMTPIGYQTNLMVYGPGGYTFRDFIRVGTPFTIIYVLICNLFISYYYNLL